MKLDKILAYLLMIMMIGAFLLALTYGINQKYFVPKISWSNITKEEEYSK